MQTTEHMAPPTRAEEPPSPIERTGEVLTWAGIAVVATVRVVELAAIAVAALLVVPRLAILVVVVVVPAIALTALIALVAGVVAVPVRDWPAGLAPAIIRRAHARPPPANSGVARPW